MVNSVVLVGRLTRDPELRYLPDGTPTARMTIAVDRPGASKNGEKITDFLDVVVWRKLAETCGQYLSKGRLVAVEGRIQTRRWEKDGQHHKVWEVQAHGVRFLDSAKNYQNGQNQAPSQPSQETDPFADFGDFGSDEPVPF